ncbi:MAG: FadR/GntR family transcriptional regulator [Acidimicrobiales bacterium]
MAVTDEAIEKIKEMIVSGVLEPGDRLPKEDELAASLGLSRSSLREAVRALVLVRILDVRQGDGTYVTSLDAALLLDAVSFVIDFHRDDSVLHFLEVRRLLEPAATAIVARSASSDQVARLHEILDEVRPSSPAEVFVENDLAFHRAIPRIGEPLSELTPETTWLVVVVASQIGYLVANELLRAGLSRRRHGDDLGRGNLLDIVYAVQVDATELDKKVVEGEAVMDLAIEFPIGQRVEDVAERHIGGIHASG